MTPRPSRAQRVVLRLPDAETELPAQVDQADDDVVTLLLSVPPADGTALRDRRVVVEYTTPRGVHRLSGAIAGTGDSPDILRVRRDGQDDLTQRRDYVRVDAVMPLQVTIRDPLRGAAHTTTLNVSAGGVLLNDPLGIPAGAVVEFELELGPGEPPIRARGRVVREEHEGEGEAGVKGVRIETIAHEDRERLVRYVTERERLAMRVARGR